MERPSLSPLPETVLLAIPVYNHGGTLRGVAERALAVHPHVLVVDDGSTLPVEAALAGLGVAVLRHERNRGKGRAIRSAAEWARERGYTHIITLDADGQHHPEDAPRFAPLMAAEPDAVIVGARDFSVAHVPFSSRFGRAFSGFWMRVQTGVAVSDMQSGFRAYPVAVLLAVPCGEEGFAFEVEILVRAAWAGFPVRDCPVGVHYPPPGERVSHFRAWRDNVRLSLLNTRLTTRAMLPLPHRHYSMGRDGEVSVIRPLRSLRLLLERDSTPRELGLSAALGMFMGTLPVFGFQTIGVLLLAGYLRLNKACALAVLQLGMPPLVPALAVEVGHYCLRGRWLTEISWRTLGHEAGSRLLEWVLGSVLLAPLLALLLGAATGLLSKGLTMALRRVPAGPDSPDPTGPTDKGGKP